MTGKEKRLLVINEIASAFEELVTGNVVALSPAALEKKGLDPKEQRQVLNLLADDKRVIKYKTVKNLKSQHDIDPHMWVEIYESAAEYDIPLQVAIDNMLESRTYKIEVLNGFEALVSNMNSMTPATEDKAAPAKITFDWRTSYFTFQGKELEIPPDTIEHYTCKLAFKNRHVPANGDDILEAYGSTTKSLRAVNDARRRVNTRVRREFGIDNLLDYKGSKVRIVKNYQ